MDRMKQALLGAMLVIAMVSTAFADDYKMTTPIAPGVATPDKLETSIGTLNLSDGNPDAGTVQKIYDNLDRSRALQAYLLGLPIVNQAGMRDSLRKFGPVVVDVANTMANSATTYRYRNVAKRRTYMRDLMRRRRVKLTGQ